MPQPLKKASRLTGIFIGATLGMCAWTSLDFLQDKNPAEKTPPVPVTYYYAREDMASTREATITNGLLTEIKRHVLVSEGPVRMLREFDKWGGIYNQTPGSKDRVNSKIKEYRSLFGVEVESKVKKLLEPHMTDAQLTGKEFLAIAIELGRESGVPCDEKLLTHAAGILKKHGVDDEDGSKARHLVSAACYSVREAKKTGDPEPQPSQARAGAKQIVESYSSPNPAH